MKSFFDANLALAQDPPKFEFFDPEGPIITSPRFLPPAKIDNCKVEESIISHGAFVSNSTITSAIVGVRSKARACPHACPAHAHGGCLLRTASGAHPNTRMHACIQTRPRNG